MATINGSTNNSNWTYKLEVSEQVPSDASTSNLSTVTVDVYIGRASSRSYIGGGWTGTVTVDGSTNNISGTIPYPTYIDGGAWYWIGGTSFSVRHNDDGSKTVGVSSTMSSSNFTPSYCSASGNVTLYTIPRYFSSTPIMEVTSKTETSVTIKWTTPENASQSQYRIGSSGSWVDVETDINKRTGTMTISGLSAGTSYTIYGDFKRKDSGLWCQTKPSVSVATYGYPYCTSTPNFTIGNSLTLSFYNPLSRNMSISLVGNNTTIGTWTTTDTSLSGFNGSGTVDNLYSSIPNSKSGTYKVLVTYNSNTSTRSTGSSYSTVESDCNPTTNGSVVDSNSTTIAITGDSSKLIAGYSTANVSYSSAPRKYASIKSVTVNGSAAYSGTSSNTVSGTKSISDFNSSTINIVGKDSRGYPTTKTLSAGTDYTLIPYIPLTFNGTVSRQTSTGDVLLLTFSGNYYNNNLGNTSNSLTISWKYREKGASTWEPGGTLVLNTDYTIDTSNNTYSSGSGSSQTAISLGSGFTYTKNYEIQIQYSDALIDEPVVLIGKKGEPIVNWDASFLNVNGDLEVNGTVRIYKQSSFASLDNFKSFCIHNAPGGISFWTLNIEGAVSAAILQKANSSYLSFIHFSYGVNMTQYKYVNGTWYT